MAELLVKAKPHWMDSFTQDDIDKLTPQKKQSYEARSQIGDIIVVKPDGWEWGKEERLPNFLVVKLPGVDIKDIAYLEQALMDNSNVQKPIMLKRRKYCIPAVWVKEKTDEVEIISNAVKIDFINSIIEKVK